MTIGVGGSTPEQELANLTDMTLDIRPIEESEYQTRIRRAQALMKQNNIAAMYLDAGTNLYYFTGLKWYKSERMVGAILPADGELAFIAPYFEEGSLRDHMLIQGQFIGWQEHESPYAVFAETLTKLNITEGQVAIDESASFFIFDGLRKAAPTLTYVNADTITATCREQKSAAEIALMQRAKDMTLTVQKAAARILKPGISTREVSDFIDQAHRKVGAKGGSSFCIVLFGLATSFPHGVKEAQILQENDWVLIDTGCLVQGYNSDITRTYAYGQATEAQKRAWQAEKDAQVAAFEQAQIGHSCGSVDEAARRVLAEYGFSPDYDLPGLPHRTGHGCGLDIHEWPYLVRNNPKPLSIGMVFSNEPMLVVEHQFGVRLEDHFYISEHGPVWFTEPSHSLDDPFGLNA